MGCSKFPALLIFAAVLLMTVTSRVAKGQTSSCAEKLVPCADYINGTGTPPVSCCDPLKEAVTNEMHCLCNLYQTPNLLKSFGINVNQAILLPGRCNISGDLTSCAKASAPTSTLPSSEPPPATPGSGNGVGKIAWTGLPSLLLFWAFMMLY